MDRAPQGAFGCWWAWGGPTGPPHLSPPRRDAEMMVHGEMMLRNGGADMAPMASW